MIIHRLHLTAEERQTLAGWQKQYKKQSLKLRQLQIVLNSAEAAGRRPTGELAQAYLRRMEIIQPPAHGSWLNMAELEFSVLSRQVLDQPFASAEQVCPVVDHWVTRQNAKAQPRNWQFTTADARIKPAKLYPTIQSFLTTGTYFTNI